jgi:cobalt-zinc-cadmium resistance protein CzcA
MIRAVIAWGLNNPLVVILAALALGGFGLFAFLNVNVEAYPDPAPPIIEVVAQYPNASPEEVERLVTIPLEVAMSGMPGLTVMRTKSLYGLCHIRNQFSYDTDYNAARQEVVNRLSSVNNLPQGVAPQISPMTPTGEMVRYSLLSPKDENGNDIYSLNDLRSLQDPLLKNAFRRIERIADVSTYGGTMKRYEIQPDPNKMREKGVSLQQVITAVANSNANVGGDNLRQGTTSVNVRSLALIGGGKDPAQESEVLGVEKELFSGSVLLANDLTDKQRQRFEDRFAGRKLDRPLAKEEETKYKQLRKQAGEEGARRAVKFLRDEEKRRIQEIRDIVIVSVNNHPIKIDDIVDGGPEDDPDKLGEHGVVVSNQTRLGKVAISRRRTDDGGVERWVDEPDKVQAIVLLRKNEASLKALEDINAKINELNERSGALLPGVQLEKHFDLTGLINVTTETVRENLLLGMGLVTVILLMFLSNVRTALIVAINIPLALLFAFAVLFLRGKSANLLSIGAVDFGIIADSSIIVVENIYRHLSSGDFRRLPLKNRILKACGEVDKELLFSRAIMVCGFLPVFTMRGPEGQIFGPMAQTYAFALVGALLLALTLSPVLCLLLCGNMKQASDNFLVRRLKSTYLRRLQFCLKHRWGTLGVMGAILLVTLVVAWFKLGREFMPELEEGNLYIRGTFPANSSLEYVEDQAARARAIMRGDKFPEVQLVASQVGRPDDGTDPSGYYNAEFHVPLRPEKEWPAVKDETGVMRFFRAKRPRTKEELTEEMKAELNDIIAADWNFSQYIRDNVTESLSGVKGDNSVKIIGPDLDELERLADLTKNALLTVHGIEDVGVFRIKGQPTLEFPVDRAACARFGVSPTDIQNVVKTSIGAQGITQIVEGEKLFDLALRVKKDLRQDEEALLKLPVDVTNNVVAPSYTAAIAATPLTGGALGVATTGSSVPPAAQAGSVAGALYNPLNQVPRRELGDLVYRTDKKGRRDPKGSFLREGASVISREQGLRQIAVKFSVRGRDLAGAVAEAQDKTKDLFNAPYRADWAGEFQQMEEATVRLFIWIPVSMVGIVLLLYMAFRSILDTLVVLANVVALSVGGVWALLLTGTNFSISAAVGFISIFGVAIMDGLLSIAYYNAHRAEGKPLNEAILEGAAKRVRPMMITALTATFGLLPAAISTRIGSQTQRPLALVVVGGMIMALLLNRYLMPVLYSFYGDREPPRSAGGMGH